MQNLNNLDFPNLAPLNLNLLKLLSILPNLLSFLYLLRLLNLLLSLIHLKPYVLLRRNNHKICNLLSLFNLHSHEESLSELISPTSLFYPANQLISQFFQRRFS